MLCLKFCASIVSSERSSNMRMSNLMASSQLPPVALFTSENAKETRHIVNCRCSTNRQCFTSVASPNSNSIASSVMYFAEPAPN